MHSHRSRSSRNDSTKASGFWDEELLKQKLGLLGLGPWQRCEPSLARAIQSRRFTTLVPSSELPVAPKHVAANSAKTLYSGIPRSFRLTPAQKRKRKPRSQRSRRSRRKADAFWTSWRVGPPTLQQGSWQLQQLPELQPWAWEHFEMVQGEFSDDEGDCDGKAGKVIFRRATLTSPTKGLHSIHCCFFLRSSACNATARP